MQVKRALRVSDAVAMVANGVLPQAVGIIPVREGCQPDYESVGRHD